LKRGPVRDLNPEQVRDWRKKAEWATPREASRMGKSGYAPKKAQLAEQVIALADSWLAQREALAAAQQVIEVARRHVEDGGYNGTFEELSEALASLSNKPHRVRGTQMTDVQFWQDVAEQYMNERGRIIGVRAHLHDSIVEAMTTIVEDRGGNLIRLHENSELPSRVIAPDGTQLWPLLSDSPTTKEK
jgi:hypothetical protein